MKHNSSQPVNTFRRDIDIVLGRTETINKRDKLVQVLGRTAGIGGALALSARLLIATTNPELGDANPVEIKCDNSLYDCVDNSGAIQMSSDLMVPKGTDVFTDNSLSGKIGSTVTDFVVEAGTPFAITRGYEGNGSVCLSPDEFKPDNDDSGALFPQLIIDITGDDVVCVDISDTVVR